MREPYRDYSTCELKVIRAHPNRFCWGQIVAWHEAGPYLIVEYHPWKVDGCTVLTGMPNLEKTQFKPYADGTEVHSSWNTLEAALVHAMAYKHDNDSTGMSVQYVLRLLNIKN